MKKLPLLSCLMIVIASLSKVNAQESMPDVLQRVHIGYTMIWDKASLIQVYPVENKDPLKIDNAFKDTTVTRDLSSKSAYGITFGTGVKLADLGKASSLVLSIEGAVNMITWDNDVKKSTTVISSPTQQQRAAANAEMKSTLLGLPLGIDFKLGSEAQTDKSYRFTTTFGLGTMPYTATTSFQGKEDKAIGMRPFVKAEAGIFAGLCFKVRAMYAFGNVDYVDRNESQTDQFGNYLTNTSKLSNKSSFTVSLIIMPFSSGWEKSRWWR